MNNQVAVKAVIRNIAGAFLIAREGDRWQAIGGRLERGETLEQGLRREVQEETGITDLTIGKVIHVDEWFAKPEGELKHIVALFYLCETNTNTVTSSEHTAYGDTIEKEIKHAIMLADKRTLRP